MHIVILGQSRSGTTLFYSLLRDNVLNYKFYETELSAKSVDKGIDNVVTKRCLDVFETIKLEPKERYRFIAMIRDPRSVLTSKHTSVPTDYFCDWDLQYQVSENRVVKRIPGYIPIYNALRTLKDVLLVRYEDMILYPEELQRGLSTIFGFEYSGSFRDYGIKDQPDHFKLALNGVRPLDNSGFNSWRKHPDRIKDQFNRCPQLFDILIEYGYESDKEWINGL